MDFQKKKTSIILIYTALFITGIISLIKIPREDSPERSFTCVSVHTFNYGKTPEFMDRYVTGALEGALSTLPFVENIKSRSAESSSVIDIEVTENINRAILNYYINNACASVFDKFPEKTTYPMISILESSDMLERDDAPFQLALYIENRSREELFEYFSRYIHNDLSMAKGVKAVAIEGKPTCYEEIEIDYISSLPHCEWPGTLPGGQSWIIGHINDNESFYPVKYDYWESIYQSILCMEDAGAAKIRTVNEIDGKYQQIKLNQRDALIITIYRDQDSNVFSIKKSIKDILKKSQIRYFFIKDASAGLYDQIYFFSTRLLLSIILINIILLLFYKSLRIIVLFDITIIVNVLICINILYNLGVTINYYSIAAFLISFGVIIDNAIIVYEYIFRHIGKKLGVMPAINRGISRAGHVVVATTITNICIFVPFVYINPDLKNQLFSFALTIVISMLVSIAVSFTLIPVLMLIFNLRKAVARRWTYFSAALYRVMISKILHVSLIPLAILLLSFFSAFNLYRTEISQIFSEYKAVGHNDYLTLEFSTGENSNPELLDEAIADYDNLFNYCLGKHDFIENLLFIKGYDNVTYKVFFKDGENSKPVILKQLCQILGNYYHKLNLSLSGLKSSHSIYLYRGGLAKSSLKLAGYDYNYLVNFAENLAKQIDAFDEIINVQVGSTRGTSVNEKVLKIKPALVNTDYQQYAGLIADLMNDTVIRHEGRNIRIKYIGDIQEKRLMELILDPGSGLRTSDIFNLATRETPYSITKENGRYTLAVEYSFVSRGSESLSNTLYRRIQNNTSYPPGIEDITMESSKRSYYDYMDSKNIYWYIALTLVIVYCITTIMVQSYLDGFLIILNIFFTFSFIVFAVYLMGLFLDINAILAFIILTGIVINGSLIFYFSMSRNKPGDNIKKRIIVSAGESCMSVMLTTLTTIAGFLPFAVLLPEGLEINRWYSMSVIMIIGVTGGMIYSLLFYPCILYLSRIMKTEV